MNNKPKPIKINAPPSFKSFLYQIKAQDPDKTLQEIMDEMAREGMEKMKKEKKNDRMFPQW